MVEGTLQSKTRELLINRPRSIEYAHITEATGIHLDWMKRFASRKHGKLCANQIQALYEFLSGRKLDV